MTLCTFVHHHDQGQEHFTTQQVPCAVSLLPLLLVPGRHQPAFSPDSFAFSRILFKWNNAFYFLLCLASFTQDDDFTICPFECVCGSFYC